MGKRGAADRVDCLSQVDMILALILVICHAAIDWYRIEKLKKQIDHPVETVLFVAVAATGTMIVMNWWFVALALGVRLLIFDYALNLMRGKNWDYLGEGAQTDKLLKKLNKWVVLAFRGLLFALSAILYY